MCFLDTATTAGKWQFATQAGRYQQFGEQHDLQLCVPLLAVPYLSRSCVTAPLEDIDIDIDSSVL